MLRKRQNQAHEFPTSSLSNATTTAKTKRGQVVSPSSTTDLPMASSKSKTKRPVFFSTSNAQPLDIFQLKLDESASFPSPYSVGAVAAPSTVTGDKIWIPQVGERVDAKWHGEQDPKYPGYYEAVVVARHRHPTTHRLLYLSLTFKEGNRYEDRVFLHDVRPYTPPHDDVRERTCETCGTLFDDLRDLVRHLQNDQCVLMYQTSKKERADGRSRPRFAPVTVKNSKYYEENDSEESEGTVSDSNDNDSVSDSDYDVRCENKNGQDSDEEDSKIGTNAVRAATKALTKFAARNRTLMLEKAGFSSVDSDCGDDLIFASSKPHRGEEANDEEMRKKESGRMKRRLARTAPRSTTRIVDKHARERRAFQGHPGNFDFYKDRTKTVEYDHCLYTCMHCFRPFKKNAIIRHHQSCVGKEKWRGDVVASGRLAMRKDGEFTCLQCFCPLKGNIRTVHAAKKHHLDNGQCRGEPWTGDDGSEKKTKTKKKKANGPGKNSTKKTGNNSTIMGPADLEKSPKATKSSSARSKTKATKSSPARSKTKATKSSSASSKSKATKRKNATDTAAVPFSSSSAPHPRQSKTTKKKSCFCPRVGKGRGYFALDSSPYEWLCVVCGKKVKTKGKGSHRRSCYPNLTSDSSTKAKSKGFWTTTPFDPLPEPLSLDCVVYGQYEALGWVKGSVVKRQLSKHPRRYTIRWDNSDVEIVTEHELLKSKDMLIWRDSWDDGNRTTTKAKTRKRKVSELSGDTKKGTKKSSCREKGTLVRYRVAETLNYL
eukprot:g2427.t1